VLKAGKRVRLSALEAAMKAQAVGGDAENRSGQAIEYDEIDPWYEPIEGAELLTALARAVDDYVIMEAHQRDAVVLWVVFTHAHDFFVFAPLLIILSPTKRCGKTRLQEVLARLAPRPQTMSGVSAAALARLIEEHRPTILIDEFDAVAKSSGEMAESLRGLLNSSFNRSGACVLKTVPLAGGGWEVRKFSTWAPVCVAGLGQVPDTVVDRSVVLRLERKLHTQTVKRLRTRDGGELHDFMRKIARFVADNERRLRYDQPDVPKELNDRARDAWEPLIAIADIAGGDWPERARNAATTLAGIHEAEAVEGDVRQTLLADIHEIFACDFPKDHPDHKDRYGPRLATKRLLEELHGLEERSWCAWGRARKPMTDVALASLLKGYGIRSGSIRLDSCSTCDRFRRRSSAIWRRFPRLRLLQAATPPQRPENLRKARIFQPPHSGPVAVRKMPETRANPPLVAAWRLNSSPKTGVVNTASAQLIRKMTRTLFGEE
jgi:putative DNA primase/helicase